MNEQETIERVAIAMFTTDALVNHSHLSWSDAPDFTRNEYRNLAKAAIAEYRRIQEEQAHNGTN